MASQTLSAAPAKTGTTANPAAPAGVGAVAGVAAVAAGGALLATAQQGQPQPGAPPSAAATAAAPVTSEAQKLAARLLIQASFGPTTASIADAVARGPRGWIERQFITKSIDRHWDYVARRGPPGCRICDSQYINAAMESFWFQAIKGEDQLRQRMVFALSQIFVVSAVNSGIEAPEAHASYLDMLADNCFGNFRTLLEAVALHPTMGKYLSHHGNLKEDEASGRIPDENFARECMQLFSIGLWQLNLDGSRRKDANGNDIPTYGQAEIAGMAKVFTGWSWNGPDTSDARFYGWDVRGKSSVRWDLPMKGYARFHSQAVKPIINGVVIRRATVPDESLRIALDTLFNHPNVGPFFGKLLIKRFVTSNPSPAYVARVATAFNNNGAGVRGDMKAVIRAVLLDPDARSTTVAAGISWGKLREPMVRFANWMRAFDAQPAAGVYRIWNLEDPVFSLGQNPLRAPSVFNWYRPDYAPPGSITTNGLTAPEFQITHETTVTGYANFITGVVDQGYGDIKTPYTTELAIAVDGAALIDRLDLLLMGGRMSPATRAIIRSAVIAYTGNTADGRWRRVRVAITLIMLSPEYIVQK